MKANILVHLRKKVAQKLIFSVTGAHLPSKPEDQIRVLVRILTDSPWGWIKEKAIPWIKDKLPAVWSFAKGFLPNSLVGMVDSVIQPHHVEQAEVIQH